MTLTVKIAPVRRTLHINLPAEEAFDLFAKGIDRWWPRTHHPGSAPMAEAIIEPFAGGRWYHRCTDGSETRFGHVLAWQPPERLLLAWTNDCHARYDKEVVTEVEVKFLAETATTTRVEFEHRHIERLGDKAEDFRGRVDGGWTVVLDSFVKAAEAATK